MKSKQRMGFLIAGSTALITAVACLTFGLIYREIPLIAIGTLSLFSGLFWLIWPSILEKVNEQEEKRDQEK